MESWFDTCPLHEGCILFVNEGENEQGPWRTVSHVTGNVCPEHRLNWTYPAKDRRGGEPKEVKFTMPCVECKEPLGWTDELDLIAPKDKSWLRPWTWLR